MLCGDQCVTSGKSAARRAPSAQALFPLAAGAMRASGWRAAGVIVVSAPRWGTLITSSARFFQTILTFL